MNKMTMISVVFYQSVFFYRIIITDMLLKIHFEDLRIRKLQLRVNKDTFKHQKPRLIFIPSSTLCLCSQFKLKKIIM